MQGPERGQVKADLIAMGADPEAVAARFATPESTAPVAFAIWPGNVTAVNVFLACGSQWRHAGMAGLPTGLDYDGVESAMRLMGEDSNPGLFADIQAMEQAALAVFAERFKSK